MVTEEKKKQTKTMGSSKVQGNALGAKPSHKGSKVQKEELRKGG